MNPDFKTVMLLLSVALGLSLAVERLLEVIKGFMKKILLSDRSPFSEKAPPVEAVLNDLDIQKISALIDDRIEEIEEMRIEHKEAVGQAKVLLSEKINKLEKETLVLAEKLKKTINSHLKSDKYKLSQTDKIILQDRLKDIEEQIESQKLNTDTSEMKEEYSQAMVILDPAPPRNAGETAQIFWLQIIGTFAGVVICYISEFGIFEYLLKGLINISKGADWLLTGILIGAGSQPIHTLIKFLTDRKLTDLKVSTEESEKGEEKETAPAISMKPVSDTTIFDVPYKGGVDREKLENTHKRISNPDMIIYHHTAMHSDSSFADVVKVIKDRGWSTGYNCVVLKDGSIHPFCRWDRYGNHAKGYNRKSLGIAFNGNYEPDPNVSFSNVNGRMGIIKPTDQQLLSAAKVIVLWCFLYDIKNEYKNNIIPHRQIADKACPGSAFPFEPFKKMIDDLHLQWKNSPGFENALNQYKQKQYLFV